MKAGLRVLGTATVRAATAGTALGLVELLRLLRIDATLGVALAALGVTLLGTGALALVAHLLGSAVARVPAIAAWRAQLAVAGAPRLRAIVAAGLVLGVGAGTWGAIAGSAAWALGRFKAATAAGVLVASVGVAALTTLVVLAASVGEPLGRWLGDRAVLQRLTTGRRAGVAAGGMAVALVVGGGIVLTRAIPGFDFAPAFMAAGSVLVVAVVAGLRAERLVPRRARPAVPGVAVALVVLGLWRISTDEEARTVVAGRGAASAAVMEQLWDLGDGDGDGYAGWLGGGDCDDADPRRSPGALEIADNGIDDNCGGGDVTKADLAPRLRVTPPRDPAAPRRSVIFVTIDTLRADHVGAYGYPRPTTPRFDALAARGALFERAYTPSPITRRAIPAIMTGRYATTLAFTPDSWPPRLEPDRHRTLGQTFAGAGYQTLAALCCDDLFNRASGVIAGIADVDDSAAKQPNKPGGKVIEAALRQLAARDPARPVFQWIHLFEPHEPYLTHAGVAPFGATPMDKYDGEIAYADQLLGKLLDGIAALPGLADQTIIAITADHGEQFEEHGARNHGKSLYAEELHVPLLIVVPGAAPQRIATPVSTIDVGATLLDLVGVSRPAGGNARSHAARVVGATPPATADEVRPVLAELIRDRQIGRTLRAVISGDDKLIWNPRAGTYELFDTRVDPRDTTNLASQAPARLVEARRVLQRTSDLELTLLPGEAKGRAGKRATGSAAD